MALLPNLPAIPGDPGDKAQHMLAFATLGVLAAAGWRSQPWWRLFAALAAFGGAIEIFQAFPPLHRDSQLTDWIADMAAAIVAIGLVRAVLRRV